MTEEESRVDDREPGLDTVEVFHHQRLQLPDVQDFQLSHDQSHRRLLTLDLLASQGHGAKGVPKRGIRM
ncbi:MAG TPA: hypothetical protein VFF44_05800 [Casimicrobiaceae bacterium]|nr:hypothetical protein [Casimicrobiaceae bacterium]